MIYLLDSNVLIDANRDYYPIASVPEYWEWLKHHGKAGNVKIPLEMYEEVNEGNDKLVDWLKDDSVKTALILTEEAMPELVSYVT